MFEREGAPLRNEHQLIRRKDDRKMPPLKKNPQGRLQSSIFLSFGTGGEEFPMNKFLTPMFLAQ